MKRIVLSIYMLLLPLLLMSAPVTQEQAMQKACEFVMGHPRMTKGPVLRASKAPQKLQTAQTGVGYYVFNIGEQQGFVVVSGDDRTPAILGYAVDGTFDATDIPENMQWWLEDYERQMSKLNQQPVTMAPIPHHQAVAPLITSRWRQTAPYNGLCPLVAGSNLSFTGCAATAMAQIMNYYKYPESTLIKIPAYNTLSYGISLPAINKNTAIDWDHILDSYDENATEVQQQAVAQLMLLCGQSIETDYTPYGSSSFPSRIPSALTGYFGYDKMIRFLHREAFRAEEWDALIYHELSEQRPVLYGGHSIKEGHSFIIDGCDEEGFYHVNWGWGGYYDSYFRLSILDPYNDGDSISLEGYSSSQHAIVGIQKPTEVETPKDDLRLMTNYLYVDSEDSLFVRQPDSTFALPVFIVMLNPSATPRSYDIGCGIYNAQDSLLLAEQLFTSKNIMYLTSVWKNDTLSIPYHLADGKYVIKAICKPVDTDEWLVGLSQFNMRIEVTIQDDVLIPRSHNAISVSGTIESTVGEPLLGSSVPLLVTLTNNGPNFNEVMTLYVNDEIKGYTYVEAEADETLTIALSYKATSCGDNYISLVIPLPWEGQTIIAAQGYVYVKGEETVSIQSQPLAKPKNASQCFDLQGRRLNKEPERGVYIRNGKKVVR